MAFINITPCSMVYLEYAVDSIPLNVVQSNGVEMTPDIDIKINKLNKGKRTFFNNSGTADKFRIKILINQEYTFKGQVYDEIIDGNVYILDENNPILDINLMEALDYWMRNSTILNVTSDNNDAVDIPDGEYIITKNASRVQNYRDGYSLWDLEFTKYIPTNSKGFNFNTTYADKVVAKYKKSKTAKKTTKTTSTKKTNVKKASVTSNKFGKCKASNMKYSKNKKNGGNCVKLLQKYLKKKGFYNGKIDSWYGDLTKKAVKKFQNKYKKKYKLSVTGKMNNKTLTAMTKV